MTEPAEIDHWGKATVLALETLVLPAGVAETRNCLLDELNFIAATQKKVDLQLEKIALSSVLGVGKVVTITFASGIFNPKRFQRSKEVTAYLGLATVIRQSGGSKSKVGQRRLRSLFIETAWIWKQKDEWTYNFYNRILGKHEIRFYGVFDIVQHKKAHHNRCCEGLKLLCCQLYNGLTESRQIIRLSR